MTRLLDSPCHPCGGAGPEQWLGPRGYSLLSWEVDFNAGGLTRLAVRSPEGEDSLVEGVCLEIAEPERVVFSGSFHLAGEAVEPYTGRITFRRV